MTNRVLNFFRRTPDAAPISDRNEIDKLYRRSRLSVMTTITLGYAMMYTTRLPLSVVKKPLIDSGIFSAADLGIIGSGLFYGYAFGKCINGFLADHANLKRFFSFGILLSALINLLMGSFSGVLFWTILWAFNGWFQGFGAPTGAVALASWFSNRERGTYYGVWSASHSIGEGLTFVGTAALVEYFGWRAGFQGPGLIGIGVAMLAFYFMADRPCSLGLPPVADWKNDQSGKHCKEHSSIGHLQLELLKSPAIWILGLSSATMYISRYAINSWGVLYLQEAHGYSLLDAGKLLGLNTAAGIAGSIAYGYISDKFFSARRPPVTLIFGILELISLLVIFYGPGDKMWLIAAAFILYGFTLSGLLATLGGLFAIDIMPKKIAGAAMGVIGIFSYLASGIQENISGHLIHKGTTLIGNVRHYDFTHAIHFWIGASVASMILAASLWKVRVKE